MIISNVGWFAQMTPQVCSKFWIAPLVLKVCQAMASQAITGVRAFNLSQRSIRIGWMLLVFYVCVCTLQWVTAIYQRETPTNESTFICRTVSASTHMGASAYYLIAILYDTVVTVAALGYLLKYKSSTPSCSVYVPVFKLSHTDYSPSESLV